MESSYGAANRPSILEVVAEYVELRKSGVEFIGLCPFHPEQTPSFHVDDSKGLFHCFGCKAGGDVISFVRRIEGVDFRTAIKRLGVETFRASPERVRARDQAGQIVFWARGISIRLCAALRDISDQVHVINELRKLPEADNSFLDEEQARLFRQWSLLCDFDDDVYGPNLMLEMSNARQSFDGLLGVIE